MFVLLTKEKRVEIRIAFIVDFCFISAMLNVPNINLSYSGTNLRNPNFFGNISAHMCAQYLFHCHCTLEYLYTHTSVNQCLHSVYLLWYVIYAVLVQEQLDEVVWHSSGHLLQNVVCQVELHEVLQVLERVLSQVTVA